MKITASTIEEFNEIQEKVNTLPDQIQNQIVVASKDSLLGIKCEFIKQNSIFLPRNTNQITDFDDYVGIYSDDFFFTIEKTKEKIVSYIFI